MIINRKELTKFMEFFDSKMRENNIWYSLDNLSMLGAKRHAGFVPWSEVLEVFTTVDEYNKMKRLFPEHIVDSGVDKKFKSLTVAFVEDAKNWSHDQPFVQVRIICPTTVNNIDKYKSKVGALRRLFKRQKDSIKFAINDLYEQKLFQGFWMIEDRKSKTQTHWIQVFSGKSVDIEFCGMKLPILKEYESVLTDWFGDDYMTSIVPEKWVEHPAPLKKIVVS